MLRNISSVLSHETKLSYSVTVSGIVAQKCRGAMVLFGYHTKAIKNAKSEVGLEVL